MPPKKRSTTVEDEKKGKESKGNIVKHSWKESHNQ